MNYSRRSLPTTLLLAMGSMSLAPSTVQACEMCRDSTAVHADHRAALASPPRSPFNASVLTMLAGTGVMAGLAGRALFHAARNDRQDR